MANTAYVVSIDVGTTTVRSCLFDGQARLLDSSSTPTETKYEGKGEEQTVTINGDALWNKIIAVTQDMVRLVPANAEASLAICTQRNSFMFWHSETKEPLGDFVCWNDKRATSNCEDMNRSLLLFFVHLLGFFLSTILRESRWKAASVLRFIGSMVSFRLTVALNSDPRLQKLYKEKKLSYGCLDTWLIMKLTGDKVEKTEPSNTSATGMFDPFNNDWNKWILRRIDFPVDILPEIVDSARRGKNLGMTLPSLLGRPLPISAIMADQQAALFGCGGLRKGDTMISMGTGTFLQKNLADRPHASMKGLYPLVAWRVDGKTTFIAEGQQHNTAKVVEMAMDMELAEEVSEISSICESVASSGGASFVPAIGGLQTPYNCDGATAVLRGTGAGRLQQLRSLMEAIAFRAVEIHGVMEAEIHSKGPHRIRVCGGISNNDFVCQTIATLLDRPVERVYEPGMTAARGVALMAGIAMGYWEEEDVPKMIKLDRVFKPVSQERDSLLKAYAVFRENCRLSVLETKSR